MNSVKGLVIIQLNMDKELYDILLLKGRLEIYDKLRSYLYNNSYKVSMEDMLTILLEFVDSEHERLHRANIIYLSRAIPTLGKYRILLTTLISRYNFSYDRELTNTDILNIFNKIFHNEYGYELDALLILMRLNLSMPNSYDLKTNIIKFNDIYDLIYKVYSLRGFKSISIDEYNKLPLIYERDK